MTKGKNVFILVFDSLRKDRLSIYEDEVDYTPNFENLAKDSTVFKNFNANAPWTLPSTSSIFTGEYPWVHEATHNNISLNTDKKLLAEKFREEGYRTKVITPNTWISPSIGTVDGFEEVENFLGIAGIKPIQKFLEKSKYLYDLLNEDIRRGILRVMDLIFEKFDSADVKKSEETVKETIEFLEKVEDDENFLLFVNLMSAHEPYDHGDPPKEKLDKHGVEDVDGVPSSERDFFENGYNEEDLERAYDASVERSDELLGQLMDKLEETNLDEETVFVVLGDHGQAIGEDEIYGHQFTVMDNVVEVPLVIRDPEQNSEIKEELFELRQLYEIIPDAAGIENNDYNSVKEVKGGYEFPDFFAGIIPEDKKDEYDVKLRYLKNRGKKIVKKIKRSGETEYRAKLMESGKEINVEDEDKNKIDRMTGKTDSGKPQGDIQDEEVKRRLEDLGYM